MDGKSAWRQVSSKARTPAPLGYKDVPLEPSPAKDFRSFPAKRKPRRGRSIRVNQEALRTHLDQLARKVIGAAYEVSNQLGAGFLEKVYERALLHELQLRGVEASSQIATLVFYKGHEVGFFKADILVERQLIVEVKCAALLDTAHVAQCLNYLRATGLHLALLMNFQHSKMDWQRLVRDF